MDDTAMTQLLGRVVTDLGAAATAPLVVIGDRLGLYKALAGGGPQTAEELAASSGCAARYLCEWLLSQAASAYIEYDAATERFSMSSEQVACFADQDSPMFMPGAYLMALAGERARPALERRFRTGAALEWHEHHADLFTATDRMFAPAYAANLLPAWLPSLDGLVDRLDKGSTVADIGCGLGTSTILLAQAFPRSRFIGFDNHPASIDAATDRARQNRALSNIEFQVADAAEFPGTGYDLVTIFDALHDTPHPLKVAQHVRESLAQHGVLMLIEPQSADTAAENLNPIGRLCYALSTAVCMPAGLHSDGASLGNQISDEHWRQLLRQAGFTRFRRAAETPFTRVFDVRP